MPTLGQTTGRAPVVAIVEWHWGGHNHTYYKHFFRAALDCGATVLPVVSDPGKIADIVESEGAAQDGPARARVMPPLEFVPSRGWRIRPWRLKDYLHRVATFGRLGRLLRAWERRSERRVDVVFFACMWDADFASGGLVSSLLRRPWSGLYLQGRAFRALPTAPASPRARLARNMFGARGLAALGVLEPVMISWLTDDVPHLPVRVFPDIVEPDDPSNDCGHDALVQSVQRVANGRPVVALLGHLQPSKGIELFLQAACDERLAGFAFLLAGELDWNMFDRDAKHRIETLFKRAGNLLVIPARLTETEFNALLRQASVLYAAYKQFPYSSNVQVKAAQLHKPMVVTAGTLMAERARTYDLGASIPEDDIESLVRVLPELASRGDAERGSLERNRLQDEFVAANSYPAVRNAMQWVLDTAVATR